MTVPHGHQLRSPPDRAVPEGLLEQAALEKRPKW